jgi:hypothetical protein
LTLPDNIDLFQDTGFIGHNPQNVNPFMSTKKPKGKEFAKEQKKNEIQNQSYH